MAASYPWYSPYHFAGNSPIENNDLDGAEPNPYRTGEFWKGIGRSVLKGINKTITYIANNPNHAGYGYSPNMKAVTPEQIKQYEINWKQQLNPTWQAQKFSENLVYGTTNFVGGIIDGDGERTAQAVPQLLSSIGAISALKGLSGLKSASMTMHEGNQIIRGALDDGVTIMVANPDELQYLQARGAQAVYMGEKGSSGLILVSEEVSRPQILEEAIHHQQRRILGDEYFYQNVEKLEVKAQDQLLRIGKQEGWSQAELDEIGRAKKSHEKRLSEKEKKDK